MTKKTFIFNILIILVILLVIVAIAIKFLYCSTCSNRYVGGAQKKVYVDAMNLGGLYRQLSTEAQERKGVALARPDLVSSALVAMRGLHSQFPSDVTPIYVIKTYEDKHLTPRQIKTFQIIAAELKTDIIVADTLDPLPTSKVMFDTGGNKIYAPLTKIEQHVILGRDDWLANYLAGQQSNGYVMSRDKYRDSSLWYLIPKFQATTISGAKISQPAVYSPGKIKLRTAPKFTLTNAKLWVPVSKSTA